jgi:hypothetical protein
MPVQCNGIDTCIGIGGIAKPRDNNHRFVCLLVFLHPQNENPEVC